MKNNNQSKKLPGFYIALCCCVIAIGAAGFFLQKEDTQSTTTPIASEDKEDFAENTVTPTEEIEVTTEPIPTLETLTAEDFSYENPDVVSAAVTVNAEEEHKFADPLPEMTVRFGFTDNALVFNEVYEDWRAHNGIDIEAPIGCSVSCVANGTVTSVVDGSYGKCVTIEHEGGFESVYAQVTDVNVNIGDSVPQGAVIATVAESKGENLKDSHLHFELHKDGKPQNPEEY